MTLCGSDGGHWCVGTGDQEGHPDLHSLFTTSQPHRWATLKPECNPISLSRQSFQWAPLYLYLAGLQSNTAHFSSYRRPENVRATTMLLRQALCTPHFWGHDALSTGEIMEREGLLLLFSGNRKQKPPRHPCAHLSPASTVLLISNLLVA